MPWEINDIGYGRQAPVAKGEEKNKKNNGYFKKLYRDD